MKKKIFIATILFILLTTISSREKIVISKFNLKKIIIENNSLLKEKDIKILLASIYEKNLLFLNNNEIEKALTQNDFIKGFKLKKKYPSTLKIIIFEAKPIAVLQSKKNKFYLTENIDTIKYKNLKNFQDLPYVFGNKEEFKIFYNNLKKINFPFKLIKKYSLYESNRWDLETIDKKIIKLPSKNYKKSLVNYLNLIKKNDFIKYKVFDYRLNNQLILK